MDLLLQFVDSGCNVVVVSRIGGGLVGNDAIVGEVEVFLSESKEGGT